LRDKLRRAGWLFLVLLFLGTGLGIGIVGFWQYTQQNNPDPSAVKSANTPPKLQGAKMDNFTPLTKIDNLQKIDLKPGTGKEVKASSTVSVHYTGAIAATGTVFESSLDSGQAATFSLDRVIKGWTDGLPGMKVGGQRRLLIPAVQAYGAQPPPGSSIPPGADLVFDITLLDVK